MSLNYGMCFKKGLIDESMGIVQNVIQSLCAASYIDCYLAKR